MARIAKKFARRVLSNVDESKRFLFNDGSGLCNLYELRDNLLRMNNETYGYHVNESKNDFSSWVKDVVQDPKLAKDLRNSRNREMAVRKISDRIIFLEFKK